MRKGIKNISCIALAFTLLCGACPLESAVRADDVLSPVTSGKHVRNIKETDKYIVKDGKSDYKIVVPEDAGAQINIAAEELVFFFSEATGIKLPIISDKDIQSKEGLQCFSLGETTLFSASEMASSVNYSTLGSDGYRMVTEDEIIYIAGYSDYGSLYGVYDFLGDALGYEFFYTDTYSIDKGVKELKLRDYDITEAPDVSCRFYSFGFQFENMQTMNRQRVRAWSDYMIPVGGRMWHNTVSGYIPVEKYANPDIPAQYHPDWYSADKRQMCYTAHGNAEEYNALIEHLSDEVVSYLEKYPLQSIITITQEDTPGWCTCEACTAETEKYGADSAMVLKLCNKVADKVGEKWRAKYGKDRENGFDILFFAYGETIDAPSKNLDEKDENGNLVMKCNEHVSVFFASTSIDSTQADLLDAPVNQALGNTIKAWRKITDRFYWWTYHDNYRKYLIPYNGMNSIANYAEVVKEMNTKMWFPQMEYNQRGTSTGWAALFTYVQTNLAWRVDLNVEEMTDRYFKAAYKDGAEDMRKFYDEYRVWAQYIGDNVGYSGLRSIFNEGNVDSKHWSRPVLEQWLGYANSAVDKIAYLQESEPKTYETTYKAIITERIFTEYLLIEIYSSDINKTELANLKAQLKDDLLKVGMSHLWELAAIADYLKGLSE